MNASQIVTFSKIYTRISCISSVKFEVKVLYFQDFTLKHLQMVKSMRDRMLCFYGLVPKYLQMNKSIIDRDVILS